MEEKPRLMKSGIARLDELTGGGVRENANILLLGPSGIEKTIFAMQFLNAGLVNKQNALYITTDISPAEIEKRAYECGWHFFAYTNRGLWFIDCYSWTLGNRGKDRKDIEVSSPSALNDLAIGIAQALQDSYKPGTKMRGAFHSLSSMLLYNNPEITFRFLQIIGARLKSAEATTLFFLDQAMHDERIVNTIKHLMDMSIELKQEKGKWYMSVPQDGATTWLEFKITRNGIEAP